MERPSPSLGEANIRLQIWVTVNSRQFNNQTVDVLRLCILLVDLIMLLIILDNHIVRALHMSFQLAIETAILSAICSIYN